MGRVGEMDRNKIFQNPLLKTKLATFGSDHSTDG